MPRPKNPSNPEPKKKPTVEEVGRKVAREIMGKPPLKVSVTPQEVQQGFRKIP